MISEKIIKAKLSKLERLHKIKILFACESGSRAWGFPSPDSDYDVRFIYTHEHDWYVAIDEKNDVIELPINAELDINGWDIRKTLRLLAKHNAVLSEWMQSPIIYLSGKNFVSEFKSISRSSFSPIASAHHYLNMSKRYYEECTLSKDVKLKKYLYCLRTTLAVKWIADKKTTPPMELSNLMTIMKREKELQKRIRSLIELKAIKDESYLHSREQELENYLLKNIDYCNKIARFLPASKTNYELLNKFFRKTISK